MKKFLLVLLVIACVGGVFFLGYVVFRSKNIVSVEIEGQMQTLYLVNETTSPDFEDAKIKVTYKNGNVKYVSPTNKSVKINDFTTTTERHGTMKITYKSGVINVDYNVLRRGMYYLKSIQNKTPSNNNIPTEYETIRDSNILFYIGDDGSFKFYKKVVQSGTSRWMLEDGTYNPSYNFSISGDTLTINNVLENGAEDPYLIKAVYENGIITPTSVTSKYENGLEYMQIVRKFQSFGSAIIDKNPVAKISYEANDIEVRNINGTNCFVFKRGKSVEDYNIYIKLEFSSYIIDYFYGEERVQMIKEVTMRLTSSMIDFLDTLTVKNYPTSFNFHYLDNNKSYKFYYIVEQ